VGRIIAGCPYDRGCGQTAIFEDTEMPKQEDTACNGNRIKCIWLDFIGINYKNQKKLITQARSTTTGESPSKFL